MDKVIELNNICKSFGSNKVLENINISFSKGEMIALVGKSGSGKSTLLNIIGLLEARDSGDVIYNGKDIKNINSKQAMLIRRYNLGYIFQNFALIENETVIENLKLALEYRNVKNKNELIEDILRDLGLEGYKDHKVYQLSGGQQQRIALARVALKPCDIILADEPTASLDKENGDIVINMLKKYRDEGKLVIIATHDMNLAESCDKKVNLDLK